MKSEKKAIILLISATIVLFLFHNVWLPISKYEQLSSMELTQDEVINYWKSNQEKFDNLVQTLSEVSLMDSFYNLELTDEGIECRGADGIIDPNSNKALISAISQMNSLNILNIYSENSGLIYFRLCLRKAGTSYEQGVLFSKESLSNPMVEAIALNWYWYCTPYT